MFKPSLTDIAFDDILTYLKHVKKVPYSEFVDYFMPKYKDTYLLMKKLKDNKHIDYNENYASIPITITEIGIDFISSSSYINESQKKYDNQQLILKSFKLNKRSLCWVIVTAALTLLGIFVAIYFGCNN
jgi:virulence-associated protein VapD